MPRVTYGNHKALFLTGILIVCTFAVFSQYKIKFLLNNAPVAHSADSIFVAGNFNDWKPRKTGQQFSPKNSQAFIELTDLAAGVYQFKFTRGNWQSAECGHDGKAVENRVINLISDTVINFSIAGWQDDFASIAKRHTASPNVQVIDTAFGILGLGRTRRIWLYLPPGYAKSKLHYPVMYMQDGQNIFDEYTSGFGEWGVDECADSLIKKGKPACIIVGIDNGPKRMNEYNPYDFRDFGKGEGDLYVDFIAQQLKPFIDRHYRTLRLAENTVIAGSSMGGLIAYYAVLKYPGIFGKGGIFSPAFWTADQINALTDLKAGNLSGTLFFYIGGREGDQYVEDMKAITEKLGERSTALIYVVTDPEGSHNEMAWRKWFPEFYKWVLANGFNNVVSLEDD